MNTLLISLQKTVQNINKSGYVKIGDTDCTKDVDLGCDAMWTSGGYSVSTQKNNSSPVCRKDCIVTTDDFIATNGNNPFKNVNEEHWEIYS